MRCGFIYLELILPYRIGQELPHILFRYNLIAAAELKEETYIRTVSQVLDGVAGF
jgi:hypothetical protein